MEKKTLSWHEGLIERKITIDNETPSWDKNHLYEVNYDLDKKETLRIELLNTLLMQVGEEDFTLLQRMWEGANISNRKLLEKSKEQRFVDRTPVDTLFFDMALVLYDEAETNAFILDLFYENCKELYPAVYKQFQTFTQMLHSETEVKCFDYLFNKVAILDRDVFNYFYFYEDEYRFNKNLDECMVDDVENTCVNLKNLENKRIRDDLATYVFNTGEKIFSSVQFERFLKKQREKLAETLNRFYDTDDVREDNLDSYIHRFMRLKAHDKAPVFSVGFNMTSNFATIGIIREQKGGERWLTIMVSDVDEPYFKENVYKPDVNELIRLYFQSCVKQHWYTNKDNFTKVELAREPMSPSPEVDLCSIMLLYDLDIMCRMFNLVKDEYYMNFSWEKIDDKKISARYENRLTSMQNTINALSQKLEDTTHKYNAIREQDFKPIQNDNSEQVALKYERALSEIDKNLEKKQAEIDELKKNLAIKDEYIELLLTEEEPDVKREVDMDLLYQKKYLIVGDLDNMPELRRAFPGSIYMETANKSLTGIKVDAIVMLIKNMSHGMFYKIKNTAGLDNVPIIYCNTRNINTIYNDIASAKL